MQLHFLITSGQRATGAMFMESLNDTVLAFIYPGEEKRTFHTFFCPALRMIALNAEGEVVFDEVITRWKWVRLPDCKYVIETGPRVEYRPFMNTIHSLSPDLPQYGALEPGTGMDQLLFSLLAEAVADMRRIREAHRNKIDPKVQRKRFATWERGQIVSSAGFILDFSDACHLPDGAVKLSHSVLKAEAPYIDEIVAASVGGIPWRHEFPGHCMRCGKRASWRPILSPKAHAPVEILWRYQRPENAVPICHHCTQTLNLLRDRSVGIDLVWGLWGPRFEALWQWHRAIRARRLPEDWDPYTHPLWPPEYGGTEWETGSGALTFAEPRPPHQVARSEEHMQALRRGLFSKKFRGRQPGETPLQKLLDFRLDIPKGDSQ